MRNKIEFQTLVNDGEGYQPVMVQGYQLKHGSLALSHPVKLEDGAFYYRPGWVVYHIAAGKLVGETCKTPFAALLSAKKCGLGYGGLYCRLANMVHEPITSDSEALTVIGRVRALPKAKRPLEHGLNASVGKYSMLVGLIDDIDKARNAAFRTSEQYQIFVIGNGTIFKVGASLESLNKFRERVIKKRKAFADTAFQF